MSEALRVLVRNVLREAAITASGASSSGICCVIQPSNKRVYLYDGLLARHLLQGVFTLGVKQVLLDSSEDTRAGVILGALDRTESNSEHDQELDELGPDVSFVTLAAARHGYGPLLYDVAMSDGFLAADRKIVSPEAAALWQRYASRADVESRWLPSSQRAHGGYLWLDKAYRLRQPSRVDSLHENHETCLHEIAEGDASRKHMVQKALNIAAVNFQGTMML